MHYPIWHRRGIEEMLTTLVGLLGKGFFVARLRAAMLATCAVGEAGGDCE
jgi:hypothetical protein